MMRDCSGFDYIHTQVIRDAMKTMMEVFDEYERKTKIMTVKRIFFDEGATVVFWEDGTKTVVRKSDSDAYDMKAAFCAAVTKKLFGSNSAIDREIRKKGQYSKRMQEKLDDTPEKAFDRLYNAHDEFFDYVDRMFERCERKDNEE